VPVSNVCETAHVILPTGFAMPRRSSINFRVVLALALLIASVQLRAAAPEITSIAPARGPTGGGTIVIITGAGFTGATQVTFGGVNATSFTVQSDTSIQAQTPAGSVGLVTVSVATPEGTASVDEGFGYGTIPLAVNDTYSAPFNAVLNVPAPGVLSNDDPNGGGGWVAELGANVTNGTLNFTVDGGFTYTPNTGFVGTDSFTYRSSNAAGFSNFAKVTINAAAPLAPLPPTGLYASEIRGNLVTLRFTPPAFGFTPTAYIIEGGPAPGSVASTIVIGATPVFSFAAPTGAFFVRVRTQAGALVSGPSNEIQIFVNVPAIPSAPDNVLALVNGNNLSLAWKNTFAGGEPTSIVLDVTGSAVASLPLGMVDSTTFNGVPAGTYNLSLRAINSVGSSFPSGTVTVTIPSGCTGVPSPPANFVAYKVGGTIFVVWEPAATGAAPTGYVLNVSGSFVGSFPTNSRTMSGSVGAGTYTFTVQATNACGVSEATAAQTVTIP
jgi:hypothetical protein